MFRWNIAPYWVFYLLQEKDDIAFLKFPFLPAVLHLHVLRLALVSCSSAVRMKNSGVNCVEEQAAHVFVVLPKELCFPQGIDDRGVAAGEEHAHPDLLVFLGQRFNDGLPC